MHRRLLTAALTAMMCLAAQGCEHKRAGQQREDWRRGIPFIYPPTMDSRIVIATKRVWGIHVQSLALVMPGDGATSGVLVTMVPGHACAPGPVNRLTLEAGKVLVEQRIARVVCRESEGQGAAIEVEVKPYVERVARALGYSYESFIQKGFEFQGAATGPAYLHETFSDRFASSSTR